MRLADVVGVAWAGGAAAWFSVVYVPLVLARYQMLLGLPGAAAPPRGREAIVWSGACVGVAALVAWGVASPWQWMGATAAALALSGVVRLDWRFRVIPDRFHVLGAIGSLAFVRGGVLIGLLLPLLLVGTSWLYERLRGREAMGLGDVKLLAWLALLLGEGVWRAMAVAVACGLLSYAALAAVKRQRLDAPFAFGPAIAVGAVCELVARRFWII